MEEPPPRLRADLSRPLHSKATQQRAQEVEETSSYSSTTSLPRMRADLSLGQYIRARAAMLFEDFSTCFTRFTSNKVLAVRQAAAFERQLQLDHVC